MFAGSDEPTPPGVFDSQAQGAVFAGSDEPTLPGVFDSQAQGAVFAGSDEPSLPGVFDSQLQGAVFAVSDEPTLPAVFDPPVVERAAAIEPPSPCDDASVRSGSDSQDTLRVQQLESERESIASRINYQVRLADPRRSEVMFRSSVFDVLAEFDLATLEGPTRAEVRAVDDTIAEAAPQRVYIGACQNPVRRWIGDGDMEGHCETKQCMVVVAVRLGRAGADVERSLILYCLDRYGKAKCSNKAPDARGLARHEYALNFIYVCIVRAATPPRLR